MKRMTPELGLMRLQDKSKRNLLTAGAASGIKMA
jgi:hypothetical protein